jgi:hypothetical protein
VSARLRHRRESNGDDRAGDANELATSRRLEEPPQDLPSQSKKEESSSLNSFQAFAVISSLKHQKGGRMPFSHSEPPPKCSPHFCHIFFIRSGYLESPFSHILIFQCLNGPDSLSSCHSLFGK